MLLLIMIMRMMTGTRAQQMQMVISGRRQRMVGWYPGSLVQALDQTHMMLLVVLMYRGIGGCSSMMSVKERVKYADMIPR